MLIYSVIAFRTFAPTHTDIQTTKLMIIMESVCIDWGYDGQKIKIDNCESIQKCKYENDSDFDVDDARSHSKHY